MSLIDLHVHTTLSDGTMTPAEIFTLAKERGISVIALCDHDVLHTDPQTELLAQEAGIIYVPSIEFSAHHEGNSLHILGFGVDVTNKEIIALVENIQQYRIERNHKMIEKFNALEIDITLEEVEKIAGGEVLGRPHFAQLLEKRGFVNRYQDAFDKYLASGKECHVPRQKIPAELIIKTILSAGGTPVLAHPGLIPFSSNDEFADLIKTLAAFGLQGIEAYCSKHKPKRAQFFIDLAHQFNLIVTGGSDYHGAAKPTITLGKFYGADKIDIALLPFVK